MPESIGENIPVHFECLCCRQPVQIWAFVPVHPTSSNTELLPEQYRRPYRQFWYQNEDGNKSFDQGQLFRIEFVGLQPVLTTAGLEPDGNPYVEGLDLVPEQGIGRAQVIWVCGPCVRMADRDRTMLWSYILAEIKSPAAV